MQNRIPNWQPDEPQACARLAIAVALGIHFIRDLTDVGEMERFILSRLDALKDSVVQSFLQDCPPPMLDAIQRELSSISLEIPKTHPLIELSNDYGTSWRYRYDALHPFFVGVCADVLVRLREARAERQAP